MNSKELIFIGNGSRYEANFVSEGRTVVQLVRKERGIVSVSANYAGMPPVVVGTYDNPYSRDAVFAVDVPQGMEVTLVSSTEVTEGRIGTWG